MVDAAERLYGPYRWGRYDMIVLPPAFPYGGMENPVLTFLTPTLSPATEPQRVWWRTSWRIAWSGNLVTNANWTDSWLNEGVTSYFENRIIEATLRPSAARGRKQRWSFAEIEERWPRRAADPPGDRAAPARRQPRSRGGAAVSSMTRARCSCAR